MSVLLVKTETLAELAERINKLACEAEDVRLEFCRAMNEARERVPKETGMRFVEWGTKYLRQPNGKPWSKWTLYSYASFGRDPQKLCHVRSAIANHGKRTRAAFRALRQSNANPADQVNALMTAWEGASDQARAQFLHLIGASRNRR